MDQTFTEADLREMVLRLAHEIRNPLATIQSAAQLIEHLQQPEGETLEFFQSIYVEVSRIDRVVQDMQRFVRLDVHTASAITVDEAVRIAAEKATSGASGLIPEVEVLGGPAVTVLVDRDQLEASIEEILCNALRFSPGRSTVEVSWRKAAGGYVSIDIDDQGPGVSEINHDRILRPFFSSSTQGTGLGLNIVTRSCLLAGGRLEWNNRPQGGARFSIVLPMLPTS